MLTLSYDGCAGLRDGRGWGPWGLGYRVIAGRVFECRPGGRLAPAPPAPLLGAVTGVPPVWVSLLVLGAGVATAWYAAKSGRL